MSANDQLQRPQIQPEMLLEIHGPDGTVQRVDLAPGKARLIIGRAPEADVRVQSMSVSRSHAELSRDEFGHWRVRDLNSRNRTHVNGQPIEKETALHPQDRIGVGEYTLVLNRHDRSPTAPSKSGASEPNITSGPKLVVSEGGEERVTRIHELIPPRVSAAHLMVISDMGHHFLQAADSSKRSKLLCQAMVNPPFFGQWAMLLRVSKSSENPAPQTLCAVRGQETAFETPHVSRSVLRAVIESGNAVLASNIEVPPDANHPAHLQKVELSIAPGLRAMAALAAPVRDDASSIDLLYVTLPPECGTGEWLALAHLASRQYQQAESAWEARRRAEAHVALERELERARKIQSRLLPQAAALQLAQGDRLDLALGFIPSAHVAGDYVDALKTRDGRVLLALADVCGHGMAAALVASSVHTLVHAGVRAGLNFDELMNGLNEHLCETLPSEVFVTMAAILIDPSTGALHYANAGHPPPLLISHETTSELRPERDDATNLPLGIAPDPLTIESAELSNGQLLALYSDGLTEMTDSEGQMMGIEGLADALLQMRVAGRASADVSQELMQLLDQRRGARPPEDDLSFLLARRV